MTVIVGLLDSGKVWMGGDSASTAGWGRRDVGDLKVFRNGEFLMGLSGQPRAAQLLRYSLTVPIPNEGALVSAEDINRFLCVDFVDAVRKCLKDGGLAEREHDVEGFGSSFLVGFRGQLVTVTGQYYVAPSPEGFAAVGCGDEYALGALHATAKLPPEKRLTIAMEAAARFSSGVAPPFYVKSLEPR